MTTIYVHICIIAMLHMYVRICVAGLSATMIYVQLVIIVQGWWNVFVTSPAKIASIKHGQLKDLHTLTCT